MSPGRRVALRLAVGDIVTWRASAIAVSSNLTLSPNENPSYWRFAGRKGTNGAAHAAAGAELRFAVRCLPREGDSQGIAGHASQGTQLTAATRCPVGSAVVTKSFGRLQAICDHVVHVVAPDGMYIHAGGRDDHIQSLGEPLLRQSFSSALSAAAGAGAHSVALPALGCGVNGWQPAVAARAAAQALADAVRSGDLSVPSAVDLVMLSPAMYRTWRAVIEKHLGPPAEEDEGVSRWEVQVLSLLQEPEVVSGLSSAGASHSVRAKARTPSKRVTLLESLLTQQAEDQGAREASLPIPPSRTFFTPGVAVTKV